MNRTRGLAILVFAGMLFAGYLQEHLKIAVNYLLEFAPLIPHYDELMPEQREEALQLIKEGQTVVYDYYYSHRSYPFLFRFNLSSLKLLKWATAPAFVLVQLLGVLAIVWLLFREKRWLRYISVSYALVFVASFAVYFLGKLVGQEAQWYAVSRELLGALQSPMPLMLILPAIWMHRMSNRND